jgi:hypothetical protein
LEKDQDRQALPDTMIYQDLMIQESEGLHLLPGALTEFLLDNPQLLIGNLFVWVSLQWNLFKDQPEWNHHSMLLEWTPQREVARIDDR